MFLERATGRWTLTLLAASLAGSLACTSEAPLGPTADAGTNVPANNNTNNSNNSNNNGPRDSGVDDPQDPDLAKSAKANVRFKRNLRIRNDFAQALSLDPAEVCTELGQYSCTDFVHQISLGGVEPYVLGLNEPTDDTTTTTPIAVERVALFACTERVKRDFSGTAEIFVDLPMADGRLLDPDAEEVGAAVDTLYKQALLRPATPAEIAHHRQLYADIAADGGPDAARDWAILSCFSVLTSMESLFY